MGVSALCSSFSIWGPHGEVVGCEIAVRAPASILLVFGGGGVFCKFFFFPLNLGSSFRGFYQGHKWNWKMFNQRIHNLLV